MNLLVKAKRQGSEIAVVTPESAGWRYVGFAAYRISSGETLTLPALLARECCLVILSGTVSAEAGNLKWEKLGRRRSVFEDLAPSAIYLPPGVPVTITGAAESEIGVATAPAKGLFSARLIEPQSMQRSIRGKGSNTRYVCDILPEKEDAESLLVVEVRTPSGHSSSYPPHKHDQDNMPEYQPETSCIPYSPKRERIALPV